MERAPMAQNAESSERSATVRTATAPVVLPDRAYQCRYLCCNQAFPSLETLNHHHQSHDYHQHNCEVCFARTGRIHIYDSVRTLKTHMEDQHSQEFRRQGRPFHCPSPKCPHTFMTWWQLNEHIHTRKFCGMFSNWATSGERDRWSEFEFETYYALDVQKNAGFPMAVPGYMSKAAALAYLRKPDHGGIESFEDFLKSQPLDGEGDK